ncbi:MAG: sulfatase, partial [bacterium]
GHPGHPDVLMILLDAARPDHFSCYGYHRETSPNIDRLAADGLVFREVFATAPYTINSLASLMSGYSWRDHNIHDEGDALSDSFLTLAELLKTHGYHTIGYTATPNYSVATGGDQGFTEFHEVWKHPDHGPRINPEFPEKMLTARPPTDFGDKPVFCYMHLIPPHEPYLPGPEHDLWHDPDYEGDIDGSYQMIMKLIRGERDWDEADLQQLIDLYDGNLHRIDASVGRILAYWRSLQRSRELLVVLLSDHGEAFQEHGKFTHNSTVYDEMIRIPLIISPGYLAEALAPARDSFLATTDIVPMLCRNLGVLPPGGSKWPSRFLRVLEDPTAFRAGILLRPAPGSPHLGYRTSRYLAICDGWNRQELYDMKVDPAATLNLRLRYPETYTTMIGQLRAVLVDTVHSAAAVESELSEEDIRTLRALGY